MSKQFSSNNRPLKPVIAKVSYDICSLSTDDAAADVLAQTEEPATTVLKPATLASLGAGTAGRTAAEALAALEAAALRPRQLASAVTGCCLTVTGSSGQRVYCQLAAARPAEGAAAGAAAGGGVCRNAAGLLAEPIDKLLLKLTERRRMVSNTSRPAEVVFKRPKLN